jgi:hypothetical protein
MNIKKLKLDRWMIQYAEHDQGIPAKHECMERLRVNEYPYMVKSYPRIGNTTWGDGRYLIGKDCFFVLNNIMYTEDGDTMFKYELSLLNCYEDITRVDKILELYSLEVQLFGEATKGTLRLSSAIFRVRERQQRRRGLAMMRKRIREGVNAKSS